MKSLDTVQPTTPTPNPCISCPEVEEWKVMLYSSKTEISTFVTVLRSSSFVYYESLNKSFLKDDKYYFILSFR